MARTGVILARLQPVHNGHLALIQKSVEENTHTYVFVGSADKFNERNPLPIGLRVQLLQSALEERFGWDSETEQTTSGKYIHIEPLDDLSDESHNDHEWGFFLYSNIVSACGSANFTMYYSDGFEIITTWFPSFVLRNNVSLCLIARNSCEKGVSATRIRGAILNNEEEFLRQYVPNAVFDKRETIREHIILSKLVK